MAGFKVTAEGVETDEHAEILTRLGCDALQGYAFSMPLQIDALHAFILRHRKTIGMAS